MLAVRARKRAKRSAERRFERLVLPRAHAPLQGGGDSYPLGREELSCYLRNRGRKPRRNVAALPIAGVWIGASRRYRCS